MAGNLPTVIYNYAIYKDVWRQTTRYQGYVLRPTEVEGKTEEWLPVAPPTTTRKAAEGDCEADFAANASKMGKLKLDPNDRTHDWTGNRRNL